MQSQDVLFDRKLQILLHIFKLSALRLSRQKAMSIFDGNFHDVVHVSNVGTIKICRKASLKQSIGQRHYQKSGKQTNGATIALLKDYLIDGDGEKQGKSAHYVVRQRFCLLLLQLTVTLVKVSVNDAATIVFIYHIVENIIN